MKAGSIFHPSFNSRSIFGKSAEVLSIWFDEDVDVFFAANQLLSSDEHVRAERFVLERDKRKFVYWRACLRHIIGTRLAIHPQQVDLQYGSYGKPILGPLHANTGLRFNLSHSADLAIIATTYSGEIGVDTEYIRAVNNEDDISEYIFSPAEYKIYNKLTGNNRIIGLINGLTRKEAFAKAIGRGMNLSLDKIQVSFAPGEIPRIININGDRSNIDNWAIESFYPEPGFIASCVLNKIR